MFIIFDISKQIDMTLEELKQQIGWVRYQIWNVDEEYLQVYDDYTEKFVGKKYKKHAYAYILCDELNRTWKQQ